MHPQFLKRGVPAGQVWFPLPPVSCRSFWEVGAAGQSLSPEREGVPSQSGSLHLSVSIEGCCPEFLARPCWRGLGRHCFPKLIGLSASRGSRPGLSEGLAASQYPDPPGSLGRRAGQAGGACRYSGISNPFSSRCPLPTPRKNFCPGGSRGGKAPPQCARRCRLPWRLAPRPQRCCH